ncbi:TPA: type 1 fimbrial protein [Escherichia coli]|uniref:fimbrial protein n=1 Tax=Escherichia coli TaxID=562 RepID=UPI000CFB312D|nr:fimbrial protein [Escherichia coli]EFA5471479.1 type 1 fimbrial protein [Escherichia coli]EFB8334501.1 type 1 fimbrial protein [Escherichia coli]EFK7798335.1 type 1 fimbrial protein [Escherichia coli]EGB0884451.1 type 1 fimbrial protein [Escherichia coli]EGB0936342.1 type 1 fimbrial protein [Escherichia coli]
MIKTVMAGAVAMALVSFGANAANQGSGTVNFKGEIIDAPCGIAPESADQTIDFGQISKAHLNAKGTSVKKDVNIKLVNCELGAAQKTVQVTFKGNTVDGAKKMLGAANTGAGIVMVGQDGQDVVFGTATAPVSVANGNNTLHYQAWVTAVDANAPAVTEGAFTAVTDFTLAYQ